MSGAFGIMGILIGKIGVLFASRKREWLFNRFMGERIRQFHFQSFVVCLPEILSWLKDKKTRPSFVEARTLAFEHFKVRFSGNLDAQFAAVTDENTKSDVWLLERRKEATNLPAAEELKPLFDAYELLRIEHQLSYANYKLGSDPSLFSSLPRRQAAILSHLSIIWIMILCAVDACVIFGVLLPGPVFSAFNSEYISILIILTALAALATRATEQGLQPEREVERYRQYRSGIEAIRERYRSAQSSAERVQAMEEMERLAFDEMRNFLVTNDNAHFVM